MDFGGGAFRVLFHPQGLGPRHVLGGRRSSYSIAGPGDILVVRLPGG